MLLLFLGSGFEPQSENILIINSLYLIIGIAIVSFFISSFSVTLEGIIHERKLYERSMENLNY